MPNLSEPCPCERQLHCEKNMLNRREQLRHALVESPKAIFRLPAATWVFAGFYMMACAVLCVLLSAGLAANDGRLGQAAVAWLFPDSWHFVVSGMGEFFFHSQSLQVLVNMAVAGSVVLVSITLFPLKEHLSHSYEKEAGLTAESVKPLPLHIEAWEETKLVLLYLTCMMSIFWVGYHPAPWRQNLALCLSTCFVAFTFAIDFLSPTLFRHRMRYTTVIKALILHPWASVAFGFLFAMPSLIAGWVMKMTAPDNWVLILSVLFAVEVFAIVWACVGGTWMSAKIWPEVKDLKKPWWGLQFSFWALLLTALSWNWMAFGAVGKSLYAKSPIFKSHYSWVSDSLRVDGLGLGEILSGEAQVGFSVDLKIENLTPVDLVLEKNRLEIRHEQDLVGESFLQPITVAAGQERIQNVGLDLNLDFDVVGKGWGLLDAEKWALTLFVEVRPGMEFPLYLKAN
jgi:hypothetical protein